MFWWLRGWVEKRPIVIVLPLVIIGIPLGLLALLFRFIDSGPRNGPGIVNEFFDFCVLGGIVQTVLFLSACVVVTVLWTVGFMPG